MRIEHIAFNVADPAAVAEWYVRHLGLHVVRRVEDPAQTHFLADESGATVLEIYHNTKDEVPDYASMHPLRLHVAFVAQYPPQEAAVLMEAGATWEEELHFPDGTHLIMLRDPWGLAIQLCKRADPLPTGRPSPPSGLNVS